MPSSRVTSTWTMAPARSDRQSVVEGLRGVQTCALPIWVSRAYVKEHFADRETMALKPEHAKLSGYFNLDNGTGKIRSAERRGGTEGSSDMCSPDLGLASLCEGALRGSRNHGAEAGACQALGLLQPGQWHRQDPRRLSARQRHDAAHLPGVARPVQGLRREHGPHP